MADTVSEPPADVLAVRGAIGGTLMGLANLVPGISGGTMLLAAGVYPGFIGAIAEMTTLRFRRHSVVLLGTITATAALAILLLAGTVQGLVRDYRFVMYSLFVGLTLGGVPLVWRLARPATPALWVGAGLAFAAMAIMAMGEPAPRGAVPNSLLLVVAGVAASSAMILPGVSGGYLLLLLGQYETILGSVDQLKRGLLGAGAPDVALIVEALGVALPLGAGVAIGIVGVSNGLKWLLARFEKPTLGVLLGLLLGAVVGLWPFQEGQPPQPGEVVKGRTVDAENAASFARDDWPVHRFEPTPSQVFGSIALVAAGFAGTVAIGRLGREAPGEAPEPSPMPPES